MIYIPREMGYAWLTRNSTHHCVITNVNNHSFSCPFNCIGREKGQIFGFQRIFIGVFCISWLRLGFSCQRWVVHLETSGLNDSHISWHPVSKLDLNYITNSQLLCLQCDLFSLSNADCILRDHVLEWFHDFRGFGLLVVGEDTGHNDNDGQHNAKVEIIIWWLLQCISLKHKLTITAHLKNCISTNLNGICNEAKNCSHPEKQWEAPKEILAKLDPLWSGWRRGQSIGAIPFQVGLGLFCSETAQRVSVVTFVEFIDGDLVDIELQLLLEIVQVIVLACEGRKKSLFKFCTEPAAGLCRLWTLNCNLLRNPFVVG